MSAVDAMCVRHGSADPTAAVERVLAFMEERGGWAYEEAVSQREHALQCATLALEAGLDAPAVAAALLHDIGHLLIGCRNHEPDFLGFDLRHEEYGAAFLRAWFVPEVTETVRLHVLAGRYLCTIDPLYLCALPAGARVRFGIQGGPLAREECALLEANPHFEAATALRRLDDRARVPGLATPDFGAFAPALLATLRADRPAQLAWP